MSQFEPFQGLRYVTGPRQLANVTAPPYDIIDAQDCERLTAKDSHNVVVVDLPDENLGEARYEHAASTFETWRQDGTIALDNLPSFYVYRMSYKDDLGRDAHTLGVIGSLKLSDPDDGRILPHEHTTAKAKSDRLDLLRATQVNLSPIWGLSLTPGLTALLETQAEPDEIWVDDHEVEHALWVMTDPERLRAISAAVDAAPVVIADGHHRFATALTYRDERVAGGVEAGAADGVMTFVVELVEDELTVRPIHRLLDGVDRATLQSAFSSYFELSEAGPVDETILSRMDAQGALTWIHSDGSGTFMKPRSDTFLTAEDLDSSRLAEALDSLDSVVVTYQHGVDNILQGVARHSAQHGVLLRPATIAQIDVNARSGHRMPAKTTFFHPKPVTGLVFMPVN